MNKDCFSYIIVNNDNGITGYVKTLPALPHDADSVVRVYLGYDSNEYEIVKLSDIKGKIVVYSLPHIFHDAIKKKGCACGQHR